MKKKAAWLTCGAVLAVAACVVFLTVSCQPNVWYCSVTPPDDPPSYGMDGGEFEESGSLFTTSPDFKVRDGRLYLRIRTAYSLVPPVGITADDWDADKIAAFRRAHPELEEYWPDKERPDGGVEWLRK